jgi:hypothetical protein
MDHKHGELFLLVVDRVFFGFLRTGEVPMFVAFPAAEP